MKGKVISGLGEGKMFMSMDGYHEQFKPKLGFEPFNGTLNLEVNSLKRKEMLEKASQIIIKGFFKNDKTFADVLCFKAKLNGINGAIIEPLKTRHKDNILEFISCVYLREKLNLKDEDEVEVELI